MTKEEYDSINWKVKKCPTCGHEKKKSNFLMKLIPKKVYLVVSCHSAMIYSTHERLFQAEQARDHLRRNRWGDGPYQIREFIHNPRGRNK